MNMQTLVIDIEGMTCSVCVGGVQRALGKLDGVGAVAVAFQSGTAAVQIDPQRVKLIQIEQAIERLGYLNPHVGHLGIFVSAIVAQHEHRAILENVEAYKDLAPGLYEMKIDAAVDGAVSSGTSKPRIRITALEKLGVRFEVRRVEDLHFEYPRHAFEKLDALSQWNESVYRTWASSARRPVTADNPWHLGEQAASKAIADPPEQWCVQRDAAQERLFEQLHGKA